jgi:glutathionyl-hydroquinone reductase
MGLMKNGQWLSGDEARAQKKFVREQAVFRHLIAPGGAFSPAPDRYHLYVSLACPWASRAVIVRKLKKLETVLPMTVVHPDMLENGWTFQGTADPVNGFDYLYQLYHKADPNYSGRVTVPVLWDKQLSTIVNNESAEIAIMLNRAFDAWGDPDLDLYPDTLAPEIDTLNERIYHMLNNAVYRAGFSRDQAAYEDAFDDVFTVLDELEERLANRRFLFGGQMTLADIRLFTTAVRFDAVYYSHFKCNLRHLWDYRNVWRWVREMYQVDGIAETVDLGQIKRHYYHSQHWVNPSGVVPVGPQVDFVSERS